MSREQQLAYHRLAELEAIKRLKARYFRLLDTQQWRELGDVFTQDVLFHGSTGDLRGRDAVIAALSKFRGGRSVHHGHMPEIDFIDDVTATGIWAMDDYVEYPTRNGVHSSFRGYGHYHETYTKNSGEWQISEWRLTRLRVDNSGSTPPESSAEPVQPKA